MRRHIRNELRQIGYRWDRNRFWRPPTDSKDGIRAFHAVQRLHKLNAAAAFVEESAPRLLKHFASGEDIDPTRVRPRIELVDRESENADVFKMASLTWSVPVSQGYGRRMRFVVWDESNWKIMGIIGLADPVFNLGVRDEDIGWNAGMRAKRLVNVMDAHVLGAVPPYNTLLGGKVVSCLIRSRDVRDLFRRKYASYQGIISGRRKSASLAVVTTSSSLGKSAVYDRLKLGGVQYFAPVGFTSGWGHFQVSEALFEEMRSYLRSRRHPYARNHQYGEGSNWRLRVVRATLGLIGMPPDLLRHGVRREVFISRLANNADTFLCGRSKKPTYSGLLSVKEVGEMAVSRWLIPRASRRDDFRNWRASQILALATSGAAPPPPPRLDVRTKARTRPVNVSQLQFVRVGPPLGGNGR